MDKSTNQRVKNIQSVVSIENVVGQGYSNVQPKFKQIQHP
jgi:hypothetical protein